MSDDGEWQPPEEGPLLKPRRMTEAEQSGLLMSLTPEAGAVVYRHFQAEQRDRPDDLRAKGWRVAVHNDYEQGGECFTFWLMTKKGSNVALKGEGKTDAAALDQIREQIQEAEAHPPPEDVAQSAWWNGARRLAESVGNTIDPDGMDLEAAASRIAGLLNAVAEGDGPETWSKYEAPQECPHCGDPLYTKILECPECLREGCSECMPAGNGCICPECEEKAAEEAEEKVCECDKPRLRDGHCLNCGGVWSPDDNDEEP